MAWKNSLRLLHRRPFDKLWTGKLLCYGPLEPVGDDKPPHSATRSGSESLTYPARRANAIMVSPIRLAA
jgi:hypothetical protein